MEDFNMKIGICDDNAEERNHLASICKELGYDNIDLYISGEDYLIRNTLPDVLFLDIGMNDIDGLEIKEFLEKTDHKTYIIFYTTHNEMMGNAFGRNVIGFLHKPASPRQIQRYLQKAACYHKDFSEITLENKQLPYNEILYIEAKNVYSSFHIADGTIQLSRKALRNWAAELEDTSFFQIHRSYIINMHHIKSFKNGKITVSPNQCLPVGKSRQKAFKAAYHNYLLRTTE